MNTIEFVKWFHEKFNASYKKEKWPTQFKDHQTLMDLIYTHKIRSIFEIGTWTGFTTLLMWLVPGIKKVKTIDINKNIKTDYKHLSHLLREKEFYGQYLKNTPVELEFCDSREYKLKNKEQYDMVFIDGNHEYEYVKSDTELALKFQPKIIVWHDYRL